LIGLDPLVVCIREAWFALVMGVLAFFFLLLDTRDRK